MEITLFAKAKTTKEGKPFSTFLSTLKKRDGSGVVCTVKFNKSCDRLPKAEECPMNIQVTKNNCQMSSKEIVNEETGEVFVAHTLWIKDWVPGTPYVDHSMDDFED